MRCCRPSVRAGRRRRGGDVPKEVYQQRRTDSPSDGPATVVVGWAPVRCPKQKRDSSTMDEVSRDRVSLDGPTPNWSRLTKAASITAPESNSLGQSAAKSCLLMVSTK